MDHVIIKVPAMAGDPDHPAAQGPAALRAALARDGIDLATKGVAVHSDRADMREASIDTCRRLAELVRGAVADGAVPLVFAGSCDVAPGVLAGVGDVGLGVVWIDAHADFNTPASSVSGFWPGMTLAVVVGDCGADVWTALRWRPVAAERVLLVGVRSLAPAQEAVRLRESAVHTVRWRTGCPGCEPEAALERLRTGVERVYVHLDLDALDPEIGSGVVDPPVPGGLSQRQLTGLLDAVCERFDVRAATIATYTPSRDDGSTLRAAIAAIGALTGERRGDETARSRPDGG